MSREKVDGLSARLQSLSPLAVLDRGYSITKSASGAVVKSIDDVKAGDAVVTVVARGSFESTVSKVTPSSKEKSHGRK